MQTNSLILCDTGAISRLKKILNKKLIQKNAIFACSPMSINELINNNIGNQNIREYDFKLTLDWQEIILYEVFKLNNCQIPKELSNFPLKNGIYQRVPVPDVYEIEEHAKIRGNSWNSIHESKTIANITIEDVDLIEDNQWQDFHDGNFDESAPLDDFTLMLKNQVIKFGVQVIKSSCPVFRGLIRYLALLELIKKIKGQNRNSSLIIRNEGAISINENLLPDLQIAASCPYVDKFISLDKAQTVFARIIFPTSICNIHHIVQKNLDD